MSALVEAVHLQSFKDIANRLFSRQLLVPVYEVLQTLGVMRILITAYQLLQEFDGENGTIAGLSVTDVLLSDADLSNPYNEKNLVTDAVNAVEALIPIDVDVIRNAMEADDLDGPNIPLIINPQGLGLEPDEFWEALDRPDGYFQDTPEDTVLVFAMCLTNNVNGDAFYRVGEYCRWPLDDLLEVYNEANTRDPKPLFKRLIKAGLSSWVSVFRIAWLDTDCEFFDWTPMECYTESVPMTVESVRYKIAEWAKAQPLIEDYHVAQAMVRSDPAVLRSVLDCWNKSGPKHTPVKTLAEMWGEDPDEDDPNDDRLVDPFYGPLDGRGTEYEIVEL